MFNARTAFLISGLLRMHLLEYSRTVITAVFNYLTFMLQSARMNLSVWPITHVYAFKLNMEGRLNDVNASFKLDLSKQACSHLDNSCHFEYELLQDDDIC